MLLFFLISVLLKYFCKTNVVSIVWNHISIILNNQISLYCTLKNNYFDDQLRHRYWTLSYITEFKCDVCRFEFLSQMLLNEHKVGTNRRSEILTPSGSPPRKNMMVLKRSMVNRFICY